MPTPTNINLNDKETLSIIWNDERETKLPLKLLRDESPDARNKGETILWKHYAPPEAGPDKPGKYEIEKIEIVGNYAIQIFWKDGYDYGIYTWDLLLKLGETK